MSVLKKILEVKKKLQDELESVSDQLNKLKEKLDELLQEKVLLDEKSTTLSNKIRNCRWVVNYEGFGHYFFHKIDF